jgi:RimJ/RimL family protein N-acetyltransferase
MSITQPSGRSRLPEPVSIVIYTCPRRSVGRIQMMQIFLETRRLVLRRFTLADLDNLVSLNADPDVMRFITGGIPISRDEIENELLPRFLGCYERFDGYGFWAAMEKRTGEFLGCFYLAQEEGGTPGEAELGFRLRKSAWGKGYATEGSRALICKGFTEFGLQRVVADTMATNIASRRVLEKAGLGLVWISQQPCPDPAEGDESGDVKYALRKADWEQQDHAAGHNPIGQS